MLVFCTQNDRQDNALIFAGLSEPYRHGSRWFAGGADVVPIPLQVIKEVWLCAICGSPACEWPISVGTSQCRTRRLVSLLRRLCGNGGSFVGLQYRDPELMQHLQAERTLSASTVLSSIRVPPRATS